MSDEQVVDLCGEAELSIGEARRFVVKGIPVCLVRVNDGYRAISDRCSHEDYPLSGGEVELDECLIECTKHGSMFSLETGEPVSFPATQPVPVYEVSIHEGTVAVKIP